MVFSQIWQNKSAILKNYMSILYTIRPYILSGIIMLGLICVYGYFRYIEIKQNQPRNKINEDSQISVIEGFEITDNKSPPTQPTQLTQQILSYPPADLYKTSVVPNYLSKFNSVNIQARGFDTRAEMEKAYRHMLQPLDSAIINRISSTVESWLKTAPTPAKQWTRDISLSLGADWLESGMPHTHANTIIMNSSWIKHPTCSTFFHELTHIAQRRYPAQFAELYKVWGFSYVGLENIQGLEAIAQRARHNPDANDFGWVWQDKETGYYYWINAVFNSITPENLTEVQWQAYKLEASTTKTQLIVHPEGVRLGDFNSSIGVPIYRTHHGIGGQPIDLAKFPAYSEYFGTGPNHYHPNEIAAQYAEYYFCGSSSPFPAYRAFVSWITAL
jgi:hypothetical protein